MVLGGAQRRLQIQELVNAEECLLGGEEEKKEVDQVCVLDMTCPDLPLTIYETSSPSFTLKREALILLIASNHDSPHPYSPFPT